VDAVVFDFDGVLARSIQVHAVAYQLVLAPFGVEVDARDVYLREGARSETIIRSFLQEAGLDPSDERVERLGTIKQRIFERTGAPVLFDWAHEVVETVDERGFEIAICTGTRRENVPGIAGALAERFGFVASEETYTHDKPHPEPFETAAEGLGVEPERCVAVENAPRGIASATKAGMFTLAVATTLDRSALEEAHRLVDEPLDALDILPERVGAPLRA
jgi:HAD superfamily hydrolase (TIGR01509 family)